MEIVVGKVRRQVEPFRFVSQVAVTFSPALELDKVFYALYEKKLYLHGLSPIGPPYVFYMHSTNPAPTNEKLRCSI